MGRGTIVGGGEDGLYTVRMDYGKEARDVRVSAIDEKIEKLNVEIAEAEDAIILAEARTAEAMAILQQVLDAMIAAQLENDNGAVAALKPQADQATDQYARVLAEEAAYRVPRDLKILERKTIVTEKGGLLAALVEETKLAWCADLTDDASGEVATIEIPGEDQAILIAPGGRAPGGGDGRLMAREIMTPEQAFFNAAILPGWQKWMPTYRKATITFLDDETNIANVELDQTTSSANRLGLNQSPQLNGIPVDYMECNAQAFAVGDRVVIGFDGMDWESPRVIGFVDNPKPCSWICNDAFYVNGVDFGLECLEEGLIDRIFDSCTVSIWINGQGPYEGLQLNYLTPPGSLPGHYRAGFGFVWHETGLFTYNFTVAFTFFKPTQGVPGHGFLKISITPPSPTGNLDGNKPDAWVGLPENRTIAEFVVRHAGKKIMHFAFTDQGLDAYGNLFTAQMKGYPIRRSVGYPVQITKLEYDYIGG